MSIKVLNYNFEGPYTSADSLKERSGVYVILCSNNSTHNPIDCGESANVKNRIQNHDRKPCWEKNCSRTLTVAVFYTPNLQSAGRVAIEQKIRAAYNFPCGKR